MAKPFSRYRMLRVLLAFSALAIAAALFLIATGLFMQGQTGIILASNSPSLLLRMTIAMRGVEAPEGNGTTMLQNAIRYQKVAIAKYLLQEGANVAARDDLGRTIVHYAFMHEPPRAEIRSLLAPYVDATLCNTPDADGATPLAFAIFHGDADGLEFLLEHGCSVCIKNEDGSKLSTHIDDLIQADSASTSSYVLQLNERRKLIQSRVRQLESISNCPD